MHVFAFRLLPIAALAALLLSTLVEPALAQAAPAPTPNKGDTAWMLTSSGASC